jgi:hypothetical protein
MSYDYWQRQTKDKPLFEDIIWSKPQQKNQSGKLLIIGGSSQAIATPAESYQIALKQGVGECKVALPYACKKMLGPKIPLDIELVESNPSGGFSIKAEVRLKAFSLWADAILFSGNLGHSSETTILLDNLTKLDKSQIFAGDSIDHFINNPKILFDRDNTLVVVDFKHLQKISSNYGFERAFTSKLELINLVDTLYDFSILTNASILTIYKQNAAIACKGRVITTFLETEPNLTNLATSASVWWLQNPSKPIEAIATSITQI